MTETDSFLRFFFNCRRRFRKWSMEKIEEYQLTKGRQLVNYVIRNSSFFKDHYMNRKLENVWGLPVINKQMMMDNFSNYNTVGFEKDDILNFLLRIEKTKNYNERYNNFNVAMSSGTSGNKGIVITSPQEEKYLQAAFFARFSFPRIWRIKWAFILRITTPAFQVKKFGQQLTHFDLNMAFNKLIPKLNNFNPNILSAPPSMLMLLAREKNKGVLTINPKRIVSYAEVLDTEVKNEIEEIFRTPVHQIYQGSEGSIALTCKNGSLHINEDLVKLQLLNKDGSRTAPGEPCFKSIITDLHKKSQPIIRYELNDVIVISTSKCSCGSNFRVIEQIMGRADDIFIGIHTESNEIQYIFPDYIRRAIISSSEEIQEYQAIQKSTQKIAIRIITDKDDKKQDISQEIIKSISRIFSKRDCIVPSIDVLFDKPLKNKFSDKMIRVKREFVLNK